jgi:hypothetical protein
MQRKRLSKTLIAAGLAAAIVMGAWLGRSEFSSRTHGTSPATAITSIPSPADNRHLAPTLQSPDPPSPEALRSSEQAAQAAADAAAALASRQ